MTTATTTQVALGLLDPSIDSKNSGDHIIREGVDRAMARLGATPADIVALTTRRKLSREELSAAAGARHVFVGGTNLLSSNMPWYRQWKLDGQLARHLSGSVSLLGVGWWQYQGRPNWYTARLLRRILGDAPQSVRDEYTREQLASIGVESINTCCPTMWDLPETPEAREARGERVVVTVTDYMRDVEADRTLLRRLSDAYEDVSLWPQGSKDHAYMRQLGVDVTMLGTSVGDFAAALDAPGTDYVGTRLHAGVFALQRGVRSTILAVDNRANEISKDTGLPVIDRKQLVERWDFVLESRTVRLRIPHDAINAWCRAIATAVTTSR